ncbi:MAG: hypothetical protein DWH79_05875, partial [Planctomycetota bacterium]
MEGLEGRSMLAVVTWDGGADGTGTDFLDAVNWYGDVLPAAVDTAVIGTTGASAAITLAGITNVAEIDSSRDIVLFGGSIVGSRFVGTDGAALVMTSSGGTLDGVTAAGDLDLTGNANVTVVNGLTLDHSTVRIGNRDGTTSGQMYLRGTQLL